MFVVVEGMRVVCGEGERGLSLQQSKPHAAKTRNLPLAPDCLTNFWQASLPPGVHQACSLSLSWMARPCAIREAAALWK